jgi:hypothetical protein
MARLIVNPRTPQAYEIQLKPGENYVGRGFANDFKLEDPSVSGSHCQLVVNGGAVLIRDLGSTNGTYVNRSQIKEASLLPGQVIRMGAVEMVFESGGKSATRPIPAAAVPIAVALPVATVVPVATPVPAAARAAGPAIPAATLLAAPLVQTTHAPVAARVAAIPTAPPPPPPSNFRPSGGTTVVLAATPAPVPVAAAHAPAPTQAAPRPALPPEPVPTAVAPEGKTACKFHPNTAGRYLCPQCNNLFCSLCVASKKITTGTSYFCRHCGVECAAVRVNFVPPKSKDKELKEYSDMTVLMRSVGFAFAASLISGGAWILSTWLWQFEAAPIYAVGVGALCGYAVKLGSQDRPGVIFSSIAAGFTLLGIAIAKVVSFFLLPVMTLSTLIYTAIGLVIALFLAWKFGGGDF